MRHNVGLDLLLSAVPFLATLFRVVPGISTCVGAIHECDGRSLCLIVHRCRKMEISRVEQAVFDLLSGFCGLGGCWKKAGGLSQLGLGCLALARLIGPAR